MPFFIKREREELNTMSTVLFDVLTSIFEQLKFDRESYCISLREMVQFINKHTQGYKIG